MMAACKTFDNQTTVVELKSATAYQRLMAKDILRALAFIEREGLQDLLGPLGLEKEYKKWQTA